MTKSPGSGIMLSMLKKIPVVVFAEGCFERDKSTVFGTIEEAQAFSWGVSVGGSLYGGGSYAGHVLPFDLDEMHERQEGAPDELARAIAWANEQSGLEMQ